MDEVCADSPKRFRVSWSRLKTFEACHRRSLLKSQGKAATIVDGRVFLPGTLADRCMRNWLSEGRFNVGGMKEFLDYEWSNHTGKDAEYTIKWRGDPNADKRSVLETVTRALEILEPILLEKVAPYAFKPEYRFTSVVGIPGPTGETVHIEIFGAVDVAVYMGDERYGLYDLKITENDVYIKSTLAQLTFYDLAFRGWTGVNPVEHAFWAPLLKDPVISLDVTDVERRQMIARIIAYCQGVWAGRWELTPDKNECFFCDTKHACPRWVNQITKDSQGRNRVSFQRPTFDLMEEKT